MLSKELAALAEELRDISGRIPQDTGWDRLRSAIVNAERATAEAEKLESDFSAQAGAVEQLKLENAAQADRLAIWEAAGQTPPEAAQ